MKSLTLRLNEAEYEQLRAVARAEGWMMSDVIRAAIYEYVQRKASHDEFRASLQCAMQENAQLLADLADT